MSFAEWAAFDSAVADADKVSYDTYYKAGAEAQLAAAQAIIDAGGISAFETFYGVRATQKMDRATLDTRFAEMNAALEAALPPPDPEA